MAGPYDSYLNQARTLFEAGDVVKAGQIWQAILKREPDNEEAKAGLYKVKTHFDARATHDGLGGAKEEPVPASPPRQTLKPATPELNSLLEAGCALYDAGLLDKAIYTWELALREDPGNALARGYIDGAHRKQEAEHAQAEPAPPPPEQAPAPRDEDQLDKLLRDGCTLFDMGQTEDALQKWERILAKDPNHALALAYTNDARRELGLAPLEAGQAASPAWVEAPSAPPPSGQEQEPADDRADLLVREGVQLYDMGMIDEATGKWEQALALAPEHRDAPGYLEMARRDKEQLSPAKTAPKAAAPKPPAPDPAEARLNAAEHLLRTQKYEEAAYAFQRLMEAGSRDSRVLQGYQQARAVLNAQEVEAPVPSAAPPPPAPVDPPRALTTKAPARGGLKLPAIPGNLALPPWLLKPGNMAMASGAVVLSVLGLYLFRSHQRDAALKDAVSAAKAVAMAPVTRNSQVVGLAETAQEILQEGTRFLADDPLSAYYRAQECLRLDPGDASAAQLLERARARMESLPPTGSGDLDKSLKGGDLEAARDAVDDQLRKAPDDAELKAKARTIYLALIQSRATNEKFAEARALLLQGQAMFPQDKTWPAKVHLLESLQGMAKGERANWIPLLG